jgi:hypothetical protein
MTKWSHLPNAHHIDWVLASVKENSRFWEQAITVFEGDAAMDAAGLRAGLRAWGAAMDAALQEVWQAAAERVKVAAESFEASAAARDSLLALVAYDDCDQYLALGYEKLKVYAVLGEKPQAILLLPMAYVREKINEKALV